MTARLSTRNFIDELTTLTVSPSAVSTLPVSNVQMAARDRVYRSTFNETVTISGHWNGEGRRPTCVGMFRHNGQGGKVQLQLYSDTSYSTSIYDSGAVSIFSDMVAFSSIDWGSGRPFMPASDPYGYLAPYLAFFTAPATAALAFRLTLTDCPAGYWEIGRLWLGTYLAFSYNAMSAEVAPVTGTENVRTRGGSLRSNIGADWRDLALDFGFITEAQRPLVADAIRQAGTGRDVVLSLVPGYGGREERDHIINGKFASLAPLNWVPTIRSTRLQITEN